MIKARKTTRTNLVRVFDKRIADRYSAFGPTACVITEGDTGVGEPLEFMPHWDEFVRNLFGWRVEADNRRWYQEANIYIPRKNAKTTTIAASCLAIPCIEKIQRGQGFIIATTEEQAEIAFNMMVAFINASEELSKRFYANTKFIEHVETGFKIRALTSSKLGKTGFKPDFVIIDEYQERKDYKLESIMETGSVTMKNPLIIKIFTAGTQDDDENMPWVKLLAKMRQIKANPNIAPRTLVTLYEADITDDPGDPETWLKANPGLGFNIDFDTFAELWEKVKDDPAKRLDFCQYNLNMIVPAGSELVDMNIFRTLKEPYKWEDLINQVCYGGLDVGPSNDMTALYLLFPTWTPEMVLDPDGNEVLTMVPRFKQLVYYFSTAKRIKQSEKETHNWQNWVNDGYLEVAGETRINDDFIAKRILQITKHFKCQAIGVDKAYASQIIQKLGKAGRELVIVNQNAVTLNDPIESLKDTVNSGDIAHDGNPIYAWNLQNAKVELVQRKYQRLCKPKAALKIDGVAAGLNAKRVFLDAPPPPPPPRIRMI